MKIRSLATWDPRDAKKYGIPKGKGFLLLRVAEESREKMGKELSRLSKVQDKKFNEALAKYPNALYENCLVQLENELEIYYRKRSLDQNALYWKLLEIEANWLNGTSNYRNGYWSKKLPGRIISPEEIHEDECETYCEKFEYYVPVHSIFGFVQGCEYAVGTVKNKAEIGGGMFKVEVWKTTSFLNVQEFTVWMNRVIDRISESGLLQSDESEFIILKQNFKEIVKGQNK